MLKECVHIILKTLYKIMFWKPIKPITKRLDFWLEKNGGRVYHNIIGREKNLIKYGSREKKESEENEETGKLIISFEELLWNYENKIKCRKMPLVSIIVPNYNHEKYLRERLESIYSQRYSKYEVILLDDCSTDNSVEILREYAQRYPENTRLVLNEKNEGKVFKQWNKGFKLANGSLIWVAESDDYCKKNFLSEMVKAFEYESVMLAFSRSVFMREGKKIWSTEEYLHDLDSFQWDKPFIMTAFNILQYGFSKKNMIPNVSSAVFRNIGSLSKEVENICSNMQLSGDWIFYLNIMKGGCVAYTNKTVNYYRIHEQSTSLRVQYTPQYYQEYMEVSKYVALNYKVSETVYGDILKQLKVHYSDMNHQKENGMVEQYYNVNQIVRESSKRKPNVLMACFSLLSGGGETYPLYLANEMKLQGIAVTVLDFHMEGRDESIRNILSNAVPLVTIKSMDHLRKVILQLGGEVIHSHHTSIDKAIGSWINKYKHDCKHVITLHGMYEAIPEKDSISAMEVVSQSCAKFIYIADKNLGLFKKHGYYTENRFVKLPNGLPLQEPDVIRREELGISEEDFVLVLASRGIEEKGWREAIEAVKKANVISDRVIQLVILGDGGLRRALEKEAPEFIHFLGVKSNVKNYFAMSDAGIVPTRFKGESYPLVIIECLQCGKPVIASDVAEVSNQLADNAGKLAGELLHLENWELNIDEISEKIIHLSSDRVYYEELRGRTKSAAEKFDITHIVGKYMGVYKNIL